MKSFSDGSFSVYYYKWTGAMGFSEHFSSIGQLDGVKWSFCKGFDRQQNPDICFDGLYICLYHCASHIRFSNRGLEVRIEKRIRSTCENSRVSPINRIQIRSRDIIKFKQKTVGKWLSFYRPSPIIGWDNFL